MGMTTSRNIYHIFNSLVVEAYRLDRYDNIVFCPLGLRRFPVGRGCSNVEAYCLDRYDNIGFCPLGLRRFPVWRGCSNVARLAGDVDAYVIDIAMT